MKTKKNKSVLLFMFSIITLSCFFGSINNIYAEDKVTIVIDPGHGGKNEGADFNGIKEKEITLKTALYLKKELEKYPNANVYITRTEDTDISLAKRAEFAESNNADIVASIHFNASVSHNKFGSEVWVSSYEKYYKLSYGIAYNLLNEFNGMGLANRGIKTRIGEGNEDYYGIIRNSVRKNIPAIIIEHCFMDNKNDETYYLSDDKLLEFAKADARAFANYYGLDQSKSSNKIIPDTSLYENGIIPPDMTPPENVILSANELDYNGTVELNIKATDKESMLSYFDYSVNGGITWSELQKLNGSENYNTIIQTDVKTDRNIIVRVYNGYDKPSESNIITIPSLKDSNNTDKIIKAKLRKTAKVFSPAVFLISILIAFNFNRNKNKEKKL